MNALQPCRWQFSYKKLCSRLSSSKVRFYTKIGRFAFLGPPLEDLGATYDDHLRLIGKCVLDFLLVLIELFLLGVTAEELRVNIGWKSALSLHRGSVDPKFHVEGVAPTNHSSSQKTRLNYLWYGIKIWTDLSSVLSQCTRLTDGRTDRIVVAWQRLYSMQRGKKKPASDISLKIGSGLWLETGLLSFCALSGAYPPKALWVLAARVSVILTVAVLGFTLGGGSEVAIIAAGGTDLYCHSKPPLTSGKLCVIINFIGGPQRGEQNFYWGAVPCPPSLNRPWILYWKFLNRISYELLVASSQSSPPRCSCGQR